MDDEGGVSCALLKKPGPDKKECRIREKKQKRGYCVYMYGVRAGHNQPISWQCRAALLYYNVSNCLIDVFSGLNLRHYHVAKGLKV